jgi:hypothetical protein
LVSKTKVVPTLGLPSGVGTYFWPPKGVWYLLLLGAPTEDLLWYLLWNLLRGWHLLWNLLWNAYPKENYSGNLLFS